MHAMASPFVNAMDSRTLGENGSCELTAKGVGDSLVALFAKLVRDAPTASIKELFGASLAEGADKASKLADLFVLAFHTRATRGMGKGEKSLFFTLVKELEAAAGVEAVLAVLPLLPHYGYWKDYLLLVEQEPSAAVQTRCCELICSQLRSDEAELAAATAAKRVPQLSLCAKYAPREKTHFDKGPLKLARRLAADMYGAANAARSQRKYRQLCSSLNAALNTTEVLMAAGRFEEIEFARVASLCLQRQRKAFLNEALKGKLSAAEEETGNRHPADAARVAARANLRAALVSKKGVTGAALQPDELVQKCMQGSLSTLEADLMHAQWVAMRVGVKEVLGAAAEAQRLAALEAASAAGSGLASLDALAAALPKGVDLGKLVPLVDVSGSMSGTPMEVAIALGILVSELTAPAFRDRVLTFESAPAWCDVSDCSTILDKVTRLKGAPWDFSTDFAAACELILCAAQQARLRPDEIPDLIVFSDMHFDQARDGHGGRGLRSAPWATHFERMQRRFAEVGVAVCGRPYPAPRIIFWNLRGDTVGFPVQASAPNTQLLSGFSPALLKLVLTGADLGGDETVVTHADGTTTAVRAGPTPAETIRTALDDQAFDPVRLALASVSTGPLAAYRFEEVAAVVGAADFETVTS